jgi:hypothetical protein
MVLMAVGQRPAIRLREVAVLVHGPLDECLRGVDGRGSEFGSR